MSPLPRRTAIAPAGLLLPAATLLLGVLFGIFAGSGAWLAAGALIAGLALVRLLLAGPQWNAVVWIVASPTVGVFADNLLQTLPFYRNKRFFFFVLIGMWAWQSVLAKRRLAPADAVERRMLWFLAVAGVSVFWVARGKVLVEWVHDDLSLLLDGYLMPMGAYAIARRIDWSGPWAERLLTLLGLAGLFLAVTAPLEALLGISAFIPTYGTTIQTLTRATGTFGNAAEFGLVISSLFIVAAYLFLHRPAGLQKSAWAGVMLLLLLALVLSKTRGPWLGFAASMLLLYAMVPRFRPSLNLLAMLAALAGSVGLPILLATQGFENRLTDIGPVYNRLAGWTTALNMVWENPLTGLGLSRVTFGLNRGEYAVGVGDVSAAWIRELAVPHNEFLNVAAMTGLPGGVLYIAVVAGVIDRMRAIWRNPQVPGHARDFAICTAAIWVGWVVNASFVDVANFHYANIIVYFLAGLAAAMAAPPASPLPGGQRPSWHRRLETPA